MTALRRHKFPFLALGVFVTANWLLGLGGLSEACLSFCRLDWIVDYSVPPMRNRNPASSEA